MATDPANERRLRLIVQMMVDKEGEAAVKSSIDRVSEYAVRREIQLGAAAGRVRDPVTGRYVSQATLAQWQGRIGAGTFNAPPAPPPTVGAVPFEQKFGGVGAQVWLASKQLGVSLAQAAENSATLGVATGKTTQQLLQEAVAFDKLSASERQAQLGMMGASKQTEQLNKLLMGFGGFALLRVGGLLDVAGKRMLSPIQMWSKGLGETTAIGSKWADNTRRVEVSTERIGGAMAEALLPAMERIAVISEDIAGFFEDHPTLAAAAAGVGIGTLAIGSLLRVAGTIITTLSIARVAGAFDKEAADKNLLASGIMLEASKNNLGAAGISSKVSPVKKAGEFGIIGTAVVLALAQQLAAFKLSQSIANRVGLETPTAKGLATGVIDATAISMIKLYGTMGKLTILSDRLSLGLQRATVRSEQWLMALFNRPARPGVEEIPSKDAVDAYIAFHKQEIEDDQKYQDDIIAIDRSSARERLSIEEDYNKRRADIIADYNNSETEAAQQFSSDSVKAASDFAKSEMDAESSYYDERMKAARDYGIEVQRAEEDHQREMQRMREDHLFRLATLEGERDAYAIVEEQRTYERDRQRAEEDYQVEARRRDEDFALQIADMESNFAQQRAQRLADYQAQRAEAAAKYEEDRKKAADEQKARLEQAEVDRKESLIQSRKAHDEKLADLQSQHNKERVQRVNAFNDQLRDLGVFLGAEYQTKDAFYAAELELLKSYIAQVQEQYGGAAPTAPVHGMGGYTRQGLAYLHNREYVMPADMVSAAERASGGYLSNDSLAAMLFGGGGRSVYVHNDNRFYGDVPALTRKQTKEMMEEVLVEILGDK